MRTLEDVLAEIGTIERAEVLAWIEARWVQPEPQAGRLMFRPIDEARLRLIHELRHELLIDVEAVPVVLGLLDEVYGLRRQLLALAHALAEAPAETRTGLLARCRVLLAEAADEEGAGSRGSDLP